MEKEALKTSILSRTFCSKEREAEKRGVVSRRRNIIKIVEPTGIYIRLEII